MKKPTAWRAAIWDTPMNGTRFCVLRKNKDVYGGEEVHSTPDGGVWTYASRTEAGRAATKLNKTRG